jgi:hypothetical protein
MWGIQYIAALVYFVSAVPDAGLDRIVDVFKHSLHFALHACLEVPHVDAHKVGAGLHDCLIHSFLAESFPLFDAFNHMGRKVSNGLSA